MSMATQKKAAKTTAAKKTTAKRQSWKERAMTAFSLSENDVKDLRSIDELPRIVMARTGRSQYDVDRQVEQFRKGE